MSISYQGDLTVGLDCHALRKLSSLPKSMMFISSLQLALAGCRLARLLEMIGASVGGNTTGGASFFHSRPISANAASALSSINPSRLGATFRIKLSYIL